MNLADGVRTAVAGSLVALADLAGGRAVLLAPLVDMAAHIDRMRAHAIGDDRLRSEGTIALPDGQALDWRYLMFAREHPVRWPHRTEVLWGTRDALVPAVDIARFATACRARVRLVNAGHAFTPADDPVVDSWLTAALTPIVGDGRAGLTDCVKGTP